MISMDRTYKTRDGREVRIYAVDGESNKPVHGAVKMRPGWEACQWRESGARYSEHDPHGLDLIEVKPKITRTYWLLHNSYGSPPAVAWQKPANMRPVHPDIIAITGPHTVTFEEGEGL